MRQKRWRYGRGIDLRTVFELACLSGASSQFGGFDLALIPGAKTVAAINGDPSRLGDVSAEDLLEWYDSHRRDLPWRRSKDPYRVWLSEIMLQQTRVETATPYFERFTSRFPSVSELADAPVDEVLALWSGLGYYRRARQLHAAAEIIAREGFPKTANGLRKLPGIGDYTAAAVASIAFDEAIAVLDGNVERVISRLRAIDGEPKRAATRRQLRAGAQELVDPDRPGDSNQALMELGATLCRPRNPRCLLCPLHDGCSARIGGEPERFPTLAKRRAPQRVVRTVAALQLDDRWLVVRRADEEALLPGTWELPWVTESGEPGAVGEQTRDQERELGVRYGGTWKLGERLASIKHSITHRAIELRLRLASLGSGNEISEGSSGHEIAWLRTDELEGRPHSSSSRKLFQKLEDEEKKRSRHSASL